MSPAIYLSSHHLNNTDIIFHQGDITTSECEAIVNPANEQLVLGAGVAGSIRRNGGPLIQNECSQLAPIKVGETVLTTGCELKARYVIHAVGPRQGEGDEDAKLASATRSSLELAVEHRIASVAFPAISTGIFGFPVDRCARLMLEEVKRFCSDNPGRIEQIHFYLWTEVDYNLFVQTAERVF